MKILGRRQFAILGIVAATVLAGCGPAEVAQGINDPYEEKNRAVHETNKQFDRSMMRPLSSLADNGHEGPVMRGIGNLAGNLALPKSIINDVLQVNADDAAHNFARFLVNTTFGIGGIFDPATRWGLPNRVSDFGETLHVWGMPEGHYVELPILGPSTQRDTLGKAVDFFINPLSYILPTPEAYFVPLAPLVAKIGDRARYSSTIESILYESADSYAQTRLLYLESRRFQLGGASLGDANDDLYGDYDDYYSD